VERNPLRAKMVKQAQRWRWSSLGQLAFAASGEVPRIPICRWPVKRRQDWLAWVNQPQTSAETAAVAHAIRHSRPYGSGPWTANIERQLGLRPLRPRGRPSKKEKAAE